MNHPSLESFLVACGSDEPLRLGVGQRDDLHLETWTFGQPFLVIGRRPESDLLLDHWQVSRRHAYLQLIEGQYYCVDLGSRTGTHGGDATERSGWLERGRAIQIGPFAVRPEWPSRPPRDPEPVVGVTWELPGRALGQAAWKMDRHLVLLGRSPACRIRIVEPDVSKFHCSLVLTPMGVWVVDLLGQKGVFVNDEPVRCARLEDGDELRVGRHTLRPRYDSPPPRLYPGPATEPITTHGGLATVVPGPSRQPGFGDLPAIRQTHLEQDWATKGRGLPAVVEGTGALADPAVATMFHQFGLMQQQMFDQFHQTMMMMFEGFSTLHREQSESLRDEFDQVRKLSREIEELRAETTKLAEAARPPARPSVGPARATNGHATPMSPPEPAPRRATPPPPDPHIDIHAQLCSRLASIESERQNRWQKILGMMTSRS